MHGMEVHLNKPAVVAALAMLAAACGEKAVQQQSEAPGAGPARAGGDIWVAGSSTVFPFATRVSEQVARTTGGSAAKVESLGTGGGIKLFCSSNGAGAPDVATASRRMKRSEFDACAKSGVRDIVELKVGYDGIVIAGAKSGADYDFTPQTLYLALAKEIPGGGSGFVANPSKTWADADPKLPAQRIIVYGPPPTSGTRDAFAELALEAGAAKLPALAALKASDEGAFKARAHTLRNDGAWIDAGENDNAIVQTLTRTPGALGVFGYSFLENNADKVKAAKVNGVAPEMAAISDGRYPLSRSLYIYVKKNALAAKPNLQAYVRAFVSDAASGRGGYLLERGLIPLPPGEHEAQKAAAQAQTPMGAPQD